MLTVQPEIIDRYVRTGQVRLVFRPVLNHGERSIRTSEAAACAGRQGQFWQMHELLFEEQAEVFRVGEGGLLDLMLSFAARLEGLDQGMFAACMTERHTLEAIQTGDREQRLRGIVFQPIFEIGGRRLAGLQSVEVFGQAIEEAIAEGG